MDRYNERLVRGKPGKEAGIVFGIGILLILSAAGLVVAGLVVRAVIALGSLPALVLGIYVIVYSRQLFQVEFEYLIVNGDIEVSKIIAKKRRKVVREIRAEDIVRAAPLSNDSVRNEIERDARKKVFDYTAGEDGGYYAIFEHTQREDCIYLLDLDEGCRQHLKEVLKSKFELK